MHLYPFVQGKLYSENQNLQISNDATPAVVATVEAVR